MLDFVAQELFVSLGDCKCASMKQLGSGMEIDTDRLSR